MTAGPTWGILLMALALLYGAYQIWIRRVDVLGLPVLAFGCFAFMYVLQPLALMAAEMLPRYLNDWQMFKALAVSAATFVAFVRAWLHGTRVRRNDRGRRVEYKTAFLYAAGLSLSIVGIALFAMFIGQAGGVGVFYGAAHGAGGKWEEQTAWVYFGPYLTYPGVTLMTAAILRGRLRRARWIPVAAIALALLAHAVLMASRGTLFPLAVALGVTPYLVGRRRPSRKTVLIGGAVLCVALLLLVGLRDELHLGGNLGADRDWSEALLMTVKISDASLDASEGQVEFLVHAAIVDTVDTTQHYGFGLVWLYQLTIHMVPRLIWPDKPYFASGVTPAEIRQVMGWQPSPGSAPGFVADLYLQFGLLTILAAYMIGWATGRLFRAATFGESLTALVAYVLVYAWGLHLFAQGLSAWVVPYAYSFTPAWIALRLARRQPKVINPSTEYAPRRKWA